MITEQQNDTVADALVIKCGWNDGSGHGPRPVIVLAGESGVVFSRSDNMGLGVKFTPDEWEKVVEFVNWQTAQEDWVNWADVPTGYDYAAIDTNGHAYAYRTKPIQARNGWHKLDDDVYIGVFSDFADNWQQSLRQRPGL